MTQVTDADGGYSQLLIGGVADPGIGIGGRRYRILWIEVRMTLAALSFRCFSLFFHVAFESGWGVCIHKPLTKSQ